MKQIEKKTFEESFKLINKHIYTKIVTDENDLYYIFTPINIENEDNKYKMTCKNCYILMVPEIKDRKVYMYDKTKEVEIDINKDILYELTFNEFVNTFRVFLNSDGKNRNDITDKIIQDEC